MISIWRIVGWWRGDALELVGGDAFEWVAFTAGHSREWEGTSHAKNQEEVPDIIEGITKAYALGGENGKEARNKLISCLSLMSTYLRVCLLRKGRQRPIVSCALPHAQWRISGYLWTGLSDAEVMPSCLSQSPLLRHLWKSEQQFSWWIIILCRFTKLTFDSGHMDSVPFRILLRSPRGFEAKESSGVFDSNGL